MAPLRGPGKAPKKFLRRHRRKGVFGARRNSGLGGITFMRHLNFFLAALIKARTVGGKGAAGA